MSSLVLETQREDDQLTSQGLSSFLTHCSQLYSLTCQGIDKDDAAILSQLGGSCSKLHSVTLIDMTDITDGSLVALMQGCPKLSDMTLSCESMLNIPTDAIFTHRFNPMLKTIDLRVCGVMWDELCVATCFSHCPGLELFHVVWGRPVSDTVAFMDTHSLGDAGLSILAANGCPKLRKMVLYSSASLTINGMLSFADKCPCLSEMIIEDVVEGDRPSHLFPPNELKTFQDRFPTIALKFVKPRVTVNPGVQPGPGGDNIPPGVAGNVFPAAGNMDVV